MYTSEIPRNPTAGTTRTTRTSRTTRASSLPSSHDAGTPKEISTLKQKFRSDLSAVKQAANAKFLLTFASSGGNPAALKGDKRSEDTFSNCTSLETGVCRQVIFWFVFIKVVLIFSHVHIFLVITFVIGLAELTLHDFNVFYNFILYSTNKKFLKISEPKASTSFNGNTKLIVSMISPNYF